MKSVKPIMKHIIRLKDADRYPSVLEEQEILEDMAFYVHECLERLGLDYDYPFNSPHRTYENFFIDAKKEYINTEMTMIFIFDPYHLRSNFHCRFKLGSNPWLLQPQVHSSPRQATDFSDMEKKLNDIEPLRSVVKATCINYYKWLEETLINERERDLQNRIHPPPRRERTKSLAKSIMASYKEVKHISEIINKR